MSSCRERLRGTLLALTLATMSVGASFDVWAQARYPGVGRAATPKEVQAWDIDVRPDFKGLPTGSGSVAQGQDVWEGKCASCHGVFGEANEVFAPLVGGTTKDDVKTGHVARLNDPTFPGRTTLMKVSTVFTLWYYINRAMPWTAPKSLSTDEVFAVVAYLLNLGGIVPDDFVLSNATMAQAQQLLPNRNGLTTDHGPDFARNNNGNLAEQQRLVGPQRGADTTKPPAPNSAAAAFAAAALTPRATADNPTSLAWALAQKNNCMVCHNVETKIVGPAFRDVAAKHGARADAESYLTNKIKEGGQGVWGAIPMPAQTLPDSEAKLIARWLAAGAKK